MRSLDFELKTDETAPRLSRMKVEEVGELIGARSPDVKLVLSELVTNSVRHAGVSDNVRVKVKVSDDKIRLEVIDQGPGFESLPASRDGMGLTIVERLARDWGVKVDGVFTVWVELDRSSQGRPEL